MGKPALTEQEEKELATLGELIEIEVHANEAFCIYFFQRIFSPDN
jgi:hypothetical protein